MQNQVSAKREQRGMKHFVCANNSNLDMLEQACV